jgi:predicted MFS family arabinose efflux permease
MTKKLQNSLRESSTARWVALFFISITLLAGYFFADVMSPLKTMIIENQQLNWNNNDYGLYTGAYSWFNVFFVMLIIGGIILDKSGIRFTGISFSVVMVLGAFLNYYALTDTFLNGGFGFAFLNSFWTDYNPSVKLAALGYAFFGVGIEILGVTGSRVVVKWFKGKEMAFAMALQVAFGRLGMLWVFWHAPRLAGEEQLVTRPVAFGLIILIVGLLSYLVYSVMDFKLDKQETIDLSDEEEAFKLLDVSKLLLNRAFVYISLLCVLFYSAVFPFMKYAADLMVHKFGVAPGTAGDIPSLLPLGTMALTPLIGLFLDFKGKSASIMIWGSILLILVHLGFAFGPSSEFLAIVLMIILGVAFSLVPAAMWPSIPKIVKEQYLGSAYSLIFWIQNWGLMGVPMLIGWSLESSNPGVTEQIKQGIEVHYDYTLPMFLLAITGILGLVFAFLLKKEDKDKNFGLEAPNKAV